MYNENGLKEFEGEMFEGKMEGDCVFYHPDGGVKFKGECRDGVPYGEVCQVFGLDAELVYEGGMKDGLYHGKGQCFEIGSEHKGKFAKGKPFKLL